MYSFTNVRFAGVKVRVVEGKAKSLSGGRSKWRIFPSVPALQQ
jgi:hypothetical protein